MPGASLLCSEGLQVGGEVSDLRIGQSQEASGGQRHDDDSEGSVGKSVRAHGETFFAGVTGSPPSASQRSLAVRSVGAMGAEGAAGLGWGESAEDREIPGLGRVARRHPVMIRLRSLCIPEY
jgi:hypothetical protein